MSLDSIAPTQTSGVSSRSEAEMGLQDLTHTILVEKLDHSEKEARTHIENLKDMQKLLGFLNEYLREVNANTKDADGTFDRQTMDPLVKKGKEFLKEAEKCRAEAKKIKESDPKMAEWLEEYADHIEDTVKACEIAEKKTTYTETERERLVENLRNQNKNLTQSVSYMQQIVQKLNNIRHEALMLAKQIIENLNATYRKIISNIGGR